MSSSAKYMRAYYERNRGKFAANSRAYRHRNREKVAESNRVYRDAHREKLKAYDRARYAAHRDEIKVERSARRASTLRFLNALKTTCGCIDCGATDGLLHFDHRPGTVKKFNIAQRLCDTWVALLVEIEKCDVRCARCHARRHALERKRGLAATAA